MEPKQSDEGTCYLCHRHVPLQHLDSSSRVEFEKEQLDAELKELNDLISRISKEEENLKHRLREDENEIAKLDALLRPLRRATAAMLPPQLMILDQEIGRQEERIQQLAGIKKALQLRDGLSNEIDRIDRDLAELNTRISKIREDLNLSTTSDIIEDLMNTYLYSLNSDGVERWAEGQIDFRISKKDFNFTVNNSKWRAKLGATLKAYFLLAYNYSLLMSSAHLGVNYPGFLMIDFPINFADKTTVADQENYLINPFCVALKDAATCQVIVAGRSFEGLEANRIELDEVWK